MPIINKTVKIVLKHQSTNQWNIKCKINEACLCEMLIQKCYEVQLIWFL